jgi:hypothetical protein
MKLFIITVLLLISYLANSQDQSFDQELFDGYGKFIEGSLNQQRFKHHEIQPLIKDIALKDGFEVRKVGESIEGRSLSLISIGEGEIDIFLWSQMHGNEPTATMAIFDILNFFSLNNEYEDQKEELLKRVKIHFLPMLNPDGAEVFKRRNALNIDINRDALRLQSPEGKTLKLVRDSLDAEFGFNLHDQSRYYNAERTAKPATISYLAPAFNYEKEVNSVRGNAMKVIVHMNSILQKYAPGQVGRYNDDFEPRAFGDNIQKWGTSAILIESGGHYEDPEKQFIRKLNFMSILSAIFVIGDGSYEDIELDNYYNIPENDRKLFDIKIDNLSYRLAGKDYKLDVGIVRDHVDNEQHDGFNYLGRIDEIGDLSTYFGYQTLDATGLQFEMGKVYSKGLIDFSDQETVNFSSLLEDGITYIIVDSIPDGLKFNPYPINLLRTEKPQARELNIGQNATFVLMEGKEVRYVVLNGFLFDTQNNQINIENGVMR